MLGVLLRVGGFRFGFERIGVLDVVDVELGGGWDRKTGLTGQFSGFALGGATDGTCGHDGDPFRGRKREPDSEIAGRTIGVRTGHEDFERRRRR